MNFSERKNIQLKKQDKSNIGGIDRQISKLVKKINSLENYYTTSSCAGRITMLKDMEQKKDNLFVFRTHEKTSFEEIKQELRKATKYKKLVYFKQEPCILHVACKNIAAAQRLIDKAKFVGFKKSGMFATRNRVICELLSTENIILPILDKGRVLVSDGFLRLIVREANKKLERTRQKINRLYDLLK